MHEQHDNVELCAENTPLLPNDGVAEY